ncbi:hypothetical protein ACIF8T_37070 [Streptomyces sp. NPDC085946]|uniref:hypothetical protein n=1 Tax=Streptomyces sp. NPDC085946 TaxID=3365744 RepID=UPI0037CF29A8
MRTRTTTAVLAAALLTLTGCTSTDGGDTAAPAPSAPVTSSKPSSEPSAEPTAGDTADLEAAVKAYTDAYFAAEAGTAHRMLSERCKKEINPLVYGTVLKQAKKDYGPDHPATDVRAEVSGDLARVSYKVKGLPKLDQERQPWAREGGTWKYDAC